MRTHYFLAIPIPDTIKYKLVEWVENRKVEFKFKSWVIPEDYHITLHFLGSISNEQLKKINGLLPRIIETWAPFELEITHSGTFGDKSTPRIFWVGLRQESALHTLYEKVGEVCSDIGLEIERRPYRPHITLARNWEGKAPFMLPTFEASEWKIQVNKVVLYQTNPEKLPKYEVISSFPFSRGTI